MKMKSNVLHYDLANDFAIKISPHEKKLPKLTLEQIDEIWKKESEKKKLFSGFAFVVDDFDKKSISGHFVPYKYLVACAKDPTIKKKLKIKPLGISGIVSSNGLILVGKRSKNSAIYPEFYECVPAGTFGGKKETMKLGPIGHLLQELKEEAAITKKDIESLRLLGLFYNKESGIFDISFLITCPPEVSKKPVLNTDEHEKLSWMTPDACKKLKTFVPESLKLLQYFQQHFLA